MLHLCDKPGVEGPQESLLWLLELLTGEDLIGPWVREFDESRLDEARTPDCRGKN